MCSGGDALQRNGRGSDSLFELLEQIEGRDGLHVGPSHGEDVVGHPFRVPSNCLRTNASNEMSVEIEGVASRVGSAKDKQEGSSYNFDVRIGNSESH